MAKQPAYERSEYGDFFVLRNSDSVYLQNGQAIDELNKLAARIVQMEAEKEGLKRMVADLNATIDILLTLVDGGRVKKSQQPRE